MIKHVYQVQTRLRDQDRRNDKALYDSQNILAKDAEDAIRVYKRDFDMMPGEYISGIAEQCAVNA